MDSILPDTRSTAGRYNAAFRANPKVKLMLTRMLTAIVLAFFLMPAHAEFSGQGEFGMVIARGNSETETANARLALNWERERWSNESTFNFVYGRDSGETNASRFVLGNKTEYDLDEKSYVLAALRYDRDRFSAFNYQSTLAIGYGRYLVDSERHRLKGEVGPGFRVAELRETGETETDLIGRGFLDYRWKISDTTELTNRFLVESGSDNTFAENALGLSVAINARLSLKAGVAVRHNTDVDPGREKTDTLSTVNLVYNFGND
jgi:putative salt-induced outer membrane protein